MSPISQSLPFIISFSLITTLWFSPPYMAAAAKSSSDYIQKACARTRYPSQCYRSLIPSASIISGNPKLLAQKAIAVASYNSKAALKTISFLQKKRGKTKKYYYSPLADCMSQISNGADRLRLSQVELKKAGASRKMFQWRMNSVQTWVSAAMTNAVACADGLKGETRIALKGNTDAVVMSTSVALKFITDFSSSNH